ncbi:S41 family peptidase [Aquimarina sp. Aq78]|uniref:S41 family peptidase n=1 Tax=Aquimarina sp. Aq78 TaxID=1191889 RepID=UPI000D0F5AD8|nr:S41 family peptidase [Aquimarina sp. Aq78]
MKYRISLLTCFLICYTSTLFAQSLDEKFSIDKMTKDLQIFKDIRIKANSGLYKYRTKKQIDSIYQWAFKEVKKSKSYRDFYNIIYQLTDFEGSLHNDISLPKKVFKSMKNEEQGYFPLPIKLIQDKVIVNIVNKEIPLGAEIVSINNLKINEILQSLYKYYTTDGVNITGKSIGIHYNFSRYYRLHYGLKSAFKVKYRVHDSDKIQQKVLHSISFNAYYKNIKNRYSKPFDEVNYKDWKENEIYSYKSIDRETGILTINDFGMGNEKNPMHLRYVSFLDSVFTGIKNNNIKNLIVDIRYNGGGTDPNDLVTYSYLTQRNFSENKQAWISFNKIPYLKYAYTKIPRFLRPLGVGKYNKSFQNQFPKEENGKFYQDSTSADHKIRTPNKNAFTGNIYLLISPRVASAGSLFAAMVAGNSNAITIGEETMGGYYGHNGHNALGYILPKSKIELFFSVVNLEQDVVKKENQIYNRGIIPDHNVSQTYTDYINQVDTQLNFVIDLIQQE